MRRAPRLFYVAPPGHADRTRRGRFMRQKKRRNTQTARRFMLKPATKRRWANGRHGNLPDVGFEVLSPEEDG